MIGEYLAIAEKANIDKYYALLGLPDEWKNGLYELGEEILSGHDLRKFFLRACRTLNENRERPDFSRWPDPVVSGVGRPDFYIFLSMLAVREICEVHRRLSVPGKITRDTCRGVGSKSMDYFFFHGEPGTVKRAIYWFLHSMRGELFKIGRFEYMLRLSSAVHQTFPEKLGGDYWVLDMHIPGGGSMDVEDAKKSWKEALRFFSHLSRDREPRAIVCVSWIFSPDLAMFMPDTSNLVKLQKEVEIYPVSSGPLDGIDFIMGTGSVNPDDWPEKTSLQRAYKRHILSGGRVRDGAMFIKSNFLT